MKTLFRLFYFKKWEGGYWFRLFGKGLAFKKLDYPINAKMLSFSQRFGLTNFIIIKNWIIEPL